MELKGVAMSANGLEKRLARLEAIEDIRKLKALYAAHCDNGYDAEAIVTCFTEDCHWEGDGRGVYRGHDGLRELFKLSPKTYPYAAHLMTNPIIEVDGDKATGQWHLLEPCNTMHEGVNAGGILSSRYADEYKRIDGKWYISRMKVTHHKLFFKGNLWR